MRFVAAMERRASGRDVAAVAVIVAELKRLDMVRV